MTERMEGSPHLMQTLHPALFLPLSVGAAAAILGLSGFFSVTVSIVIGVLALPGTVIGLLLSFKQRSLTRWRLEGDVLYVTGGLANRRQSTIRLSRILYCELRNPPLASLLGCAKVTIYGCGGRRSVCSMVLQKNEATALLGRIAAYRSVEGSRPKRATANRYAALLSAVSSTESLVLLGLAAIVGCCGGHSIELYLLAAALWCGAVLYVICRTLSECRLSVRRLPSGFTVQMGVFGGKHLWIPRRSVAGIVETRSPLQLLAGMSRLELLCEGGRRIPCVQWYEESCSEEAALALLDCEGEPCAVIADHAAMKRRYAARLTADAFAVLLAWFLIIRLDLHGLPMGIAAALSAALISGTALHCLCAMKAAIGFGFTLYPGVMRIGGMRLLTTETLTLRRGKLAAVGIRRNVSERMSGECTAELIPSGCRRGFRCRCASFDRITALAERFY